MRVLATRSNRPALTAEPNVIPFIDVMLVLLVIFMVSAPPPDTELRVNLPVRGVPAKGPENQPTAVRISGTDGAIVLAIEGEVVPADAFRTRLYQIAQARNPGLNDLTKLFLDANIVVSADEAVRYDDVFGVVDEIGAAGFRKVNLVVEDTA